METSKQGTVSIVSGIQELENRENAETKNNSLAFPNSQTSNASNEIINFFNATPFEADELSIETLIKEI